MYSKCWEVIRDDAKKTFEVIGQETNNNHFTNSVHGMQRAGMNVSCITPPVNNRAPNKDTIKVLGYVKEDGLYQRLMKEYRTITQQGMELW